MAKTQNQTWFPEEETINNTNTNQANTWFPEEQEPTIGEDITQSILNTPHALAESLRQLPGEAEAAAYMPLKRSLQNLGQGAVNLATMPISLGNRLVDYLVKKHVPYAEQLRQYYPATPAQDVFGLGEPQRGDVLWQSAIPFGGLGRATRGLGALPGAATRAGGGALYSTAQGANPVESLLTGTILEGLSHGATAIPRQMGNIGKGIEAGTANYILNKSRKGIETGESLTPEQAARNALQQYTNIEGQPMGADFGTLIGNKNLADLYGITGKIPFTKGRQQIAKVDKELFDKKEAQAKLEHEKQTGTLSTEKQNYEQQLRTAIGNLQKNKDILETQLPKINTDITETSNLHQQQQQAINQAPQVLSSLKHPEINHNQLFKTDIETGFNEAKNAVNEAYAPFNNLDVDLNSLKMPEEFESQYRKAFNDFKQESENLKELFKDDKDLGNDISKEINRASAFFKAKKAPPSGAKNRIGIEPLFKLTKATPKDITTHIRNLQSLAEEAYSAGRHRESAMLSRMASGLKNDMKRILTENGYHDAVAALEAGDELFKSDVLPYYRNREVKKIASDPDYHLNDSSRVTLANALHQPNMQNILNNMSQSAKDASLYELITRGKYGKAGHGLTPKEIAKAFQTHLKSNVRESIESTNPHISNYLENLTPMLEENAQLDTALKALNKDKEALLKESEGVIKTSETKKAQAEEKIPALAEKLKQSDLAFQKALNERFGIPKPKTAGVWKDIKKMFNPLNAASLGAGTYFLHSITPTHLVESLGITIPFARKLNKMLTETEKVVDKETGAITQIPKLLKHYHAGTKVKPNPKQQSALAEKIRNSLMFPKNIPVYKKEND
jgi:hypothetical protein